MNNGYVLVKDKDGQLKYYKDGKFFDLDEVKFSEKIEKEIAVSQPPVPVVPPKPAVNEAVKEEKKLEKVDFELEELKPSDDLVKKRESDKLIVETQVQAVVNKLKISFSNPKIKERFTTILRTYFRGIRRKKEIEYILGVKKIDGGLELPKEKTRLILNVIDQVQVELDNERRKVVYQAPVKKVVEEKDDLVPIVDKDHRLAPPPPAIKSKKSNAFDKMMSTIEKEAAGQAYSLESSLKKPVTKKIKRKVKTESKKPNLEKMVDIKPTSRMRGPLEELAYMDLKNFKLLDTDPKKAAEDVYEKIALLADQGFPKKVEGITAWQQCPVVRLYKEMSVQGIREAMPIQKVIEKRQRENKEVLSLTEFETISDINKHLTY
ncbi:hypothetical protein HN958_02250 [Candidatus Falkowbacteria bacterium]|jgi:hypothetical protein|nr:hypothetical protein [Candidatus Falkowbacteria bacterium]MBT7007305.1 hypothetical protein [Candidatus Falkowbacteria bacterium]